MNLSLLIRATALSIGFALTSAAHAVVGSPGTLDATFGSAGYALNLTPGLASVASGVVVQPDGKILISGICADGIDPDRFCVVRRLANGAPDTSFGTNGIASALIGAGLSYLRAIALQPDGKIVLAGECTNAGLAVFCALRYLANGTLDLSFNVTGKVVTPVGGRLDSATAIALQTDGKIVLIGSCKNAANMADFCAVRYNTNGSLDRGFNGTGKVITAVVANNNWARAVAVQLDGKLVLTGGCKGDIYTHFCALRYLANGTLDTSFKRGLSNVGAYESDAYAVALRPDGRLVLAGICDDPSGRQMCAARLNADGTLDVTFNGAGTIITAITGHGTVYATALALEPDGKLVLGGSCRNDVTNRTAFCVLRYHADGGIDASFNGSGVAFVEVNNIDADSYSAIAPQPDGKIVLAGTCDPRTVSDPQQFCAIRLDGGPFGYQNCKPDLDGDGALLANNDVLIYARVALGFTGAAVVNGVSFASHATRKTWPLIRDYLVTQCGMSLVPE